MASERASRTLAFVSSGGGGRDERAYSNFLRLIAASEFRVADEDDGGASFAGIVNIGSGVVLDWQGAINDVISCAEGAP